MPQMPIPEYWKERVYFHLSEEGGKVTVRELFKRLKVEAEGLEKTGIPGAMKLSGEYPSERSIARIKNNMWLHMSNLEKNAYRVLRWPESFGTPELPWEASAACLELLAFRDRSGRLRPSARVAKWFYRLTLAAPEAPAFVRDFNATNLATSEKLGILDEFGNGRVSDGRMAEVVFATTKWRSEDGGKDLDVDVNGKSSVWGRFFQSLGNVGDQGAENKKAHRQYWIELAAEDEPENPINELRDEKSIFVARLLNYKTQLENLSESPPAAILHHMAQVMMKAYELKNRLDEWKEEGVNDNQTPT